VAIRLAALHLGVKGSECAKACILSRIKGANRIFKRIKEQEERERKNPARKKRKHSYIKVCERAEEEAIKGSEGEGEGGEGEIMEGEEAARGEIE